MNHTKDCPVCTRKQSFRHCPTRIPAPDCDCLLTHPRVAAAIRPFLFSPHARCQSSRGSKYEIKAAAGIKKLVHQDYLTITLGFVRSSSTGNFGRNVPACDDSGGNSSGMRHTSGLHVMSHVIVTLLKHHQYPPKRDFMDALPSVADR